MSVSKKWVGDPKNVAAVLKLSRRGNMTMQRVAAELGTTWHNVWGVLKEHATIEERKAWGSLHHSTSKLGEQNPMSGRKREAHPNWKGRSKGKNGYTTHLDEDGNRIPHHVYVVLKELGLKKLPKGWEIHHIDTDPGNDSPDNLALVTGKGHKTIHSLYRGDPAWMRLKKLKLAEIIKYTT